MAVTTEGTPSLDWTIICDDVRAEVGDKISLMGLFDSIYAQTFPALHPRLAVVASYSGGPGDFKSELLLVGPTGEVIQPMGVATLKLTGQRKSHRHIAITLNAQFKSEGIYQIKVLLDNNLLRSIPLPVQKIGRTQ